MWSAGFSMLPMVQELDVVEVAEIDDREPGPVACTMGHVRVRPVRILLDLVVIDREVAAERDMPDEVHVGAPADLHAGQDTGRCTRGGTGGDLRHGHGSGEHRRRRGRENGAQQKGERRQARR